MKRPLTACVGCCDTPSTLGKGSLVLLGTLLSTGISPEEMAGYLCPEHRAQIEDGLRAFGGLHAAMMAFARRGRPPTGTAS